jgi:hypothetical protein
VPNLMSRYHRRKTESYIRGLKHSRLNPLYEVPTSLPAMPAVPVLLTTMLESANHSAQLVALVKFLPPGLGLLAKEAHLAHWQRRLS